MYINIQGTRINLDNVNNYSHCEKTITFFYTNKEWEQVTFKTNKDCEYAIKTLDKYLDCMTIWL